MKKQLSLFWKTVKSFLENSVVLSRKQLSLFLKTVRSFFRGSSVFFQGGRFLCSLRLFFFAEGGVYLDEG